MTGACSISGSSTHVVVEINLARSRADKSSNLGMVSSLRGATRPVRSKIVGPVHALSGLLETTVAHSFHFFGAVVGSWCQTFSS